jgi:hypothetical protein
MMIASWIDRLSTEQRRLCRQSDEGGAADSGPNNKDDAGCGGQMMWRHGLRARWQWWRRFCKGDGTQAGERRGWPLYPCDRTRAATADRPRYLSDKSNRLPRRLLFSAQNSPNWWYYFLWYWLSKQHFKVTSGKFVWHVFYKGIRQNTCVFGMGNYMALVWSIFRVNRYFSATAQDRMPRSVMWLAQVFIQTWCHDFQRGQFMSCTASTKS